MVATAYRVNEQTAEHINEEIRRQTDSRVMYFSMHPDQIDSRLRELDEEWDIERVLEANAASLSLFGAVMGLLGGRKWFLLNGVVAGFLLQHAVQGWCPPVALFRRLGYRTPREIETERAALKALRGDFKNIGEGQDASANIQQAIEAARR